MNLGKSKTENVYEAFFNLEKMLKRDEYTYLEKLKMLKVLKAKCDISLLGVIILNNKKQIRSDFFWNDSEIIIVKLKNFLYIILLSYFDKLFKQDDNIT